MLTRTVPGLIVVMVLSLFSGAAAASDGELLAEACVRSIARTTHRTVDAVHDQRDHGVAKIRRLDDAGASDESLVGVARRTNHRIGEIASAGAESVTDRAQACVRKLTDIGADQALIDAVRAAAERARQRIGTAASNSTDVVRRVLENALDG
ncbi:MAG: hypothetical protein RIB60_01375 [Phycisphaerales bacterium]